MLNSACLGALFTPAKLSKDLPLFIEITISHLDDLSLSLFFLNRSPDSAKIKSKMVYAGSKDALTRAMVGISTKVTATDMSELTSEIMVDACRKF